MSDSESEHETSKELKDDEEPTIDKDIVVTKYNMAADIVNAVMKEVIAGCTDGRPVSELCDLGDKLLSEKTAKVFKKEKEVKNGIAFPTCICVNNVICHFSPLRSDAVTLIKDGDLVKIDLGAHVDGFIAVAAQTIVVGATPDKKVTGKKADAVWAAYNAMEVALRMLRPEAKHKNTAVTDAIQRVVESYGCKPIENMLSHQLLRHKIDGDKTIIQNPGEKQRSDMDKCTFDVHEIYAIDVLVSTGEGKARDVDQRTTVYKKTDDLIYQLKMKASRTFFSDAMKKYGNMPFSLRNFDDEVKAKMGVNECERHQLLKPYPVLYERDGEFVAQFKATVLVMPNGLIKIAGGQAPDAEVYVTEKKIDDEKLAALLTTSLKPSKKAKQKKKKAEAAQAPNGEAK